MTSTVTPFRRRVHAVVTGLSPGEVVTYGEVAVEAGHPGAARAVGSALRGVGDALPWWRVVPASGRLVEHLAPRQSLLLRAEGVTVVDGRVRAPDDPAVATTVASTGPPPPAYRGAPAVAPPGAPTEAKD